MSMWYVCRCGDETETPAGSIELLSQDGNTVIYLCEPCLYQALRFCQNLHTDAVRPAVTILALDPEDYDDLSLPVWEEEISDDWLRELHRAAS